MPARKTIPFFISALLIGGLVGAGITHLIDRRKTRLNWLGHNCIAARSLINQIDLLSKGEVADLKIRMEEELDVHAVIIGLFVDKTNSDASQSACLGLKMISEHRSKSPFSSPDPKTKELVKSALSKAQ
jgi:hypothetical protein